MTQEEDLTRKLRSGGREFNQEKSGWEMMYKEFKKIMEINYDINYSHRGKI